MILVCMGCIIISTVPYVVMKARTQSEFLAITITVAVAITLCVCVWQIFTQLENMVPKSERERIKAEKLAEAVADSSSESIASAAADAYAELHPVENTKPTKVSPSATMTETPVNESEPVSVKEEAPTVEPCDANATYLAGIKYHENATRILSQNTKIALKYVYTSK